MARGAIFWRRFVKENSFCRDDFRQLVAFGAAHILVRTAQRKNRQLIVVEQRRLPLHGGVTVNAMGGIAFGELFSVNIFMTLLALLGSGFEINVEQPGLQVGRLVAIDARCGTVSAGELEIGFRVIES